MDTSNLSDARVLLARQPILNADLDLLGYELLYRDEQGKAQIDDGDQATSQVLLNYFTGLMGADNAASSRLMVFVNLDSGLLQRASELPELSKQLVLEVLEHIEPDEAVTRQITELKQAGYRIALDDFTFDPRWAPVLPLVDVIKVDYMALSHDEIAAKKSAVESFNGQWLAEKVESREDFEHAKANGFSLFQGYFFAKPITLSGQKFDSSKQSVLNLLSKLQDEEITIDDISNDIAVDPKLSVQLLRIVNSAAFNLRAKIESIQQAVVMLGLEQLKRWLSLLALANSNAPLELMRSL